MNSLSLAVDIGNTTIKLAVMRGTKILKIYQIPTSGPKRLRRDISRVMTRIPLRYRKSVGQVIVSSVVPRALRILKPALSSRWKSVLVLGRDIVVPIKNCYHPPRHVGQDRLATAYAALCLYQAPLIIIDLGTAITIDVVSQKKEYLGGLIVPGIGLSAQSLNQKTALLPKVSIDQPRQIIGSDTKGSILSGIFYGYGEMLSGLIKLISKTMKTKPRVIMTGGYATLMKKYIHADFVIHKTLVFEGLQMILRQRIPKNFT